ncbi:MAG: DNA polymerase IV [Acidimicrobiales bacterium]
MGAERTILHVDMDAFYVSVELLRRPELRGLPVVVGASSSRGVVAAASYEARRYGVHSAMSSSRARSLCPDAVFLPPDMALYLEVSERLHSLFVSFTPLVEQISVDEAFLDVTGARALMGDPASIAARIREEVRSVENLGCSIGVAPNNFRAKLASVHAKPRASREGVKDGHGVWVVPVGGELEFLLPLPVSALWGVGPATRGKLEGVGVHTVADLARLDLTVLQHLLGEASGAHLHALARGVDERAVEPDRAAKSIGHEETFAADLTTPDEVHAEVVRLCGAVARRIRAAGTSAGTLMLKVRYADFSTVTRSVSPGTGITSAPAMVAALEPLLAALDPAAGVRLLGVHAQRLGSAAAPAPTLFEDGADSVENLEREWRGASLVVDSINEKFGPGVIGPASALGGSGVPGERPFGPEEG